MAQALYLKLILVVWRGMKMIQGQNKENKVCFQSCFGGDLLFGFFFAVDIEKAGRCSKFWMRCFARWI